MMLQQHSIWNVPSVSAPFKKPAQLAAPTSIQSLMEWRPAFIQMRVGGGLQNLGNSCFMNATLQCLAYLPPMTQTLMTGFHSSHCSAKEFCLLCECEKLFPRLVSGNSDTLYPVSIYENLTRISESLHPGQQEDAHEFLQSALVAMEESLDEDDRKEDSNLIRDVFAGETQSRTECLRCRNVTTRREPFLCLSVDAGYTLHESLTELCKSETMEGKDAYDCDTCRSRERATRQTLLSKLPPVLAIHIKRFRTSIGPSGLVETRKNAQHVSFPLLLDVSSDHVSKDYVRSSVNDDDYELRGLIVHRGDEAWGGHYYAMVRGCDGSWYRMDDNYVSSVSVGEVLNQDAYILFYTRRRLDVAVVDDEEDDDDSLSDGSVSSDSDSEGGNWDEIDDWIVTPMSWMNGGWVG